MSVIAISTAITIVTTSIQLYFDYTRDIEDIETEFNSLELSHVPVIIQNVWIANNVQVQLHMDSLAQLPLIESLVVLSNGKVQWKAGEITSKNRISRAYPLIYHYAGRDVSIGMLIAEASLDEVYDRLWRKLFLVLLTNGVKTFLVAGFILLIFQRLITRHLNAISLYARNTDITDAKSPLTPCPEKAVEYA